MLNVVKDEFGEIISIEIDGEKLDSDDGETWITPKALFRKLRVSDLPEKIIFELWGKLENRVSNYLKMDLPATPDIKVLVYDP